MPPKQPAKRQRVRVTNKTLESRQFSSVRLPNSNEIPTQKVDVDAMYAEVNHPSVSSSNHHHRQHQQQRQQRPSNGRTDGAAVETPSSQATTSSLAFDPIPNDPMFFIVENSKYWPPPSLEELQKSTGVSVVGTDGFDSYDRREDDKAAKKERTKVIKGELNHPRGKPRQNLIVKLDDSSNSSEDEAEHKAHDASTESEEESS